MADALAHERIERARHRDWVVHGEARGRSGGGVLALVRDEAVVGFCEYGPTEDADDDPRAVGHIMRLYVHPKRQGRGGGTLLIESACERLASDGLASATLWTPEAPWNRAHRFYTRLGWLREDVFSSEDPPDVRYRRPLF